MSKKIHKGCGGVIEDGKCQKCGKVWGKFEKLIGKGIEEKEEKFDPKEYRRRIREGRDIFQ